MNSKKVATTVARSAATIHTRTRHCHLLRSHSRIPRHNPDQMANQLELPLLPSISGELLPETPGDTSSDLRPGSALAAFPPDKRRRSRLCVSLVDLPMLGRNGCA